MSTHEQRRPAPTGGAADPEQTDTLWQHAALCQLALPLRAPNEREWRRDAGTAAARIEAGPDPAPPLPAGKLLRRLLLHVYTEAVRTGSGTIELGDGPAALAQRLDLAPGPATLRELAQQVERLGQAKLVVALARGPELSVFDARGAKPRAGAAGWRPALRLNGRFLASLLGHAVALRRDAVAALADAPAALDVYAWIAFVRSGLADGATVQAGWDELRARFGSAAQSARQFRTAFAPGLAAACDAHGGVQGDVGEDGVTLRFGGDAAPVATEQPVAEDPPAPPPVEVPVQAAAAPPVPPPAAVPAAPRPAAPRPAAPLDDELGLMPHLTGLPQAVWLQRRSRTGLMTLEVGPAGCDAAQRSILALEPIVLQVSGRLLPRELERVAQWAAANAELIERVWAGDIRSPEEAARNAKRAPATRW